MVYTKAVGRWEDAETPELETEDISFQPEDDHFLFSDLPAAVAGIRGLGTHRQGFVDYIYRNSCLSLLHNPALEVYGEVGEAERDFKMRCQEPARRKRDEESEKIRASYKTKLGRLQDKVQREERELAEDEAEHDARKREEYLSAGESVLNLLRGRRSSRALSSASRKRRLTAQAKADVNESLEAIEDLEDDVEDLKLEMQEALNRSTERWAAALDEVEEIQIAPRKTYISVELFGLAWVPRWLTLYLNEFGSESVTFLPAFQR